MKKWKNILFGIKKLYFFDNKNEKKNSKVIKNGAQFHGWKAGKALNRCGTPEQLLNSYRKIELSRFWPWNGLIRLGGLGWVGVG